MSNVDPEHADIIVRSRSHVQSWVNQERSKYADHGKYKEGTPGRDIIREAVANNDTERALNFVYNYMGRTLLQGFDSLNGRQALGKALVAMTHILETACEYHGQMPEPGHTSGEISQWDDCPIPLPGSANEAPT